MEIAPRILSICQNVFPTFESTHVKIALSICGYESKFVELKHTFNTINNLLLDPDTKQQERSIVALQFVIDLINALVDTTNLFTGLLTLLQQYTCSYVDVDEIVGREGDLEYIVGEEKKGILKIVCSKTLLNKHFLKWMFISLNVIVEICQAAFGQEKSEGKMGREKYLMLSIITSSICLIMAIFEALHEVKINGMVWQKRGYCCWFYYPGNQERIFDKFSIYFGLISSLIQLIINLIEKITRKDIVKFEYMPLLLSIFYFVAALIGSKDRKSLENVSIRCNVHGEIKGIIVEGCENRVFQCPHCQLEGSNV